MRRLSAFRLFFLLILGALLVGNIYFGVMYYKAYRSQGALAQEIATVEAQIAAMVQLHSINALEAELAALEEELNDAPFPKDVDTNEIFDLVERSAARAALTIDAWAVGSVTEEGVDGSAYDYQVHSYEVTASGALSDIFRFLTQVEDNAPYETARIDDVALTYESGTDSWALTFDILVYAQPELE